MADVHTPEQRSYNMSRIHSKNTKPEELVRKFLFSQGFRYRKNDAKLPGKPDIVLPKYKAVIFVNGCFWHGHDCRNTRPADNQEYWQKKKGKVPEYNTVGHSGPDHEQAAQKPEVLELKY